jgi:hypothetical protein
MDKIFKYFNINSEEIIVRFGGIFFGEMSLNEKIPSGITSYGMIMSRTLYEAEMSGNLCKPGNKRLWPVIIGLLCLVSGEPVQE